MKSNGNYHPFISLGFVFLGDFFTDWDPMGFITIKPCENKLGKINENPDMWQNHSYCILLPFWKSILKVLIDSNHQFGMIFLEHFPSIFIQVNLGHDRKCFGSTPPGCWLVTKIPFIFRLGNLYKIYKPLFAIVTGLGWIQDMLIFPQMRQKMSGVGE